MSIAIFKVIRKIVDVSFILLLLTGLYSCSDNNSDSDSDSSSINRIQNQHTKDSDKSSVWGDDDQEILVSSSSFWDGESRFRATRDSLTEAQLDLLKNLKLTNNKKLCIAHVSEYRVEVKNTQDEVKIYHAGEGDSVCDGPSEIISSQSLRAFMETYSCLSSSQTRGSHKTIETAFILNQNQMSLGCKHGFFGGPVWLQITIDQPTQYIVQEVPTEAECSTRGVSIGLYSNDGKTLLNQGAELQDSGCWFIEHKFENSGTYFLLLNGQPNKDYFVRISKLSDMKIQD